MVPQRGKLLVQWFERSVFNQQLRWPLFQGWYYHNIHRTHSYEIQNLGYINLNLAPKHLENSIDDLDQLEPQLELKVLHYVLGKIF